MADIRTVFIDMEHGADYAMDALLLEQDDGLDTAVIISLFTDRRATRDDVLPDAGSDRRGTWMDAYADVTGDKMGSRLWLLERAKLTQETVVRVREYIQEALDWMVRDGVAKRVDVDTFITRHHPLGIIGAAIDIVKPDGQTTRFKFETLWSAV